MGKACQHCTKTGELNGRCFPAIKLSRVLFSDSVVCVGGDGMFSEILHGLIGRTQQEAGCCENDPAVTLQPCPLHIGIIPAGNDALRQLFKCLMDGVGRRAVTAHILLFCTDNRLHRLRVFCHRRSDRPCYVGFAHNHW